MRVDIRHCVKAAESLGSFDRYEIAEFLGVSPLKVGGWLAKMEKERGLLRIEGTTYHWDPGHDAATDTVEAVDARIGARRLGKFTARQFASATNVTSSAASVRIRKLEEKGIVRDSGKVEWHEHGKPATIWEVVPIEAVEPLPPKQKPIEREIAERVKREEVVEGLGAMNIPHKEIRSILQKVMEAGGTVVEARKKYRVTLPDGSTISMSKTPSDWRAPRKIRAQLARHGVAA